MYAYIIRRRIFYANFFPESLFLSHKASFHHEKLAEWPKSYTYWRFPNSIRSKHATSYLHYAHILDLLKTWNHRPPALLLRKEVIVVLGAGWHNLKMVLMFETFLSFCPIAFFVEIGTLKVMGIRKNVPFLEEGGSTPAPPTLLGPYRGLSFKKHSNFIFDLWSR